MARFCRGPRLETRGPREIWLYERAPVGAPAFEVPACRVRPSGP
mgnify:CR=1 FL=1